MIEKHDRLRKAREKAGFATATQAAARFGWKYPTYSGHENGSRGIKAPDLQKYASAFGVQPEWLEFGRTASSAGTPAPAPKPHGFEQPITEYIPPTDTLRNDMGRLARSLSGDAKSVYFRTISAAIPGLALMPGDVLMIDGTNTKANPGQIVLAQIADENTASARTELRLKTADGTTEPFGHPTTKGPNEIESTLGVVIAMLRGAPAL